MDMRFGSRQMEKEDGIEKIVNGLVYLFLGFLGGVTGLIETGPYCFIALAISAAFIYYSKVLLKSGLKKILDVL